MSALRSDPPVHILALRVTLAFAAALTIAEGCDLEFSFVAALVAATLALGPAISWIVFSEGGLKVDTKLRALDRTGKPIPGLYAAGSAGQGGVILEGHGHHLGWGFTSGRLAGANAARE